MNERRLVEQESPSWTAQGARVPGFGPTLLRPPPTVPIDPSIVFDGVVTRCCVFPVAQLASLLPASHS